MKKNLLLIVLAFTTLASVGQTAVNFNTSDCNSNTHDLFTELNTGKVIVLTWVKITMCYTSRGIRVSIKRLSVRRKGVNMY